MRTKPLMLVCTLLVCLCLSSQAQVLKKLKSKVNKTLNNSSSPEKTEEDNSSSASSGSNNSSNASASEDANSAKWCEGLDATGGGSGNDGGATKDGVDYKKAYSSTNGFNIIYDESSLGLSNNSKEYRLILSERVNNKTQFVFVENGKVVATDTKVHPEWLAKKSSQTVNGKDDSEDPMKKYIVGDTMKQNIPKSDAKSATVQKVDDDQVEMALQIARQSDDYKNMSEAEKKEFEETFRAGVAKNNSMAGTTVNVPAQQGGTVAVVNGYFLVVKGKKLAKFMMPPTVEVSKDETKVFAVGINEDGVPVMLTNGKITLLDKNRYSASMGRIVRSPDQKKFVYLEQKKMSEKELEAAANSAGSGKHIKIEYNVIKADASTMMMEDYNYNGKFWLTNSGALVNMNEETGEVFADNKPIGKFPVQSGDRLNADALLIGSDIRQVAYYNGNEGSFTYLDGTVKKLDIVSPRVISEGGKSYLSWFRKCGKEIYIASFAY